MRGISVYTVLLSEFKDILTLTEKFTNNDGKYRDDTEEIHFHQYLMNDRSKGPDKKFNRLHHLPTNKVDLKLLWSCISKIWNQFVWLPYMKEIITINKFKA